ncbi:predicted protein [Postia placenta Mad-698-R]|nr:predicted protein [Postia placenta Mad-698-R]
MRDAANTTVRGRANDIQDALSYNITLPQPYRTELIFTIQSDWAEFGLLSPCGVIIENKANPYLPLTQGSETKIHWGRKHSHDQRRETIRFSIINDGSPIDFYISHGSDGGSGTTGCAEVLIGGANYVNDKITDNNWNTQWYYQAPMSGVPQQSRYRLNHEVRTWDETLQGYLREIGVRNRLYPECLRPCPSRAAPLARPLSLVVQHLRPPRLVQAENAAAAPAPSKEDPYSPRLPESVLSSASPHGTPQRADFQDFLACRLLVTSPRRMAIDDDDAQTDGGGATPAPLGTRFGAEVVSLPPPFVQAGSGAGGKLAECKDVVSLGGSAVFLYQLRLAPPFEPGETTGRTPAHERNVSTDTTDSEADSESGEASGNLTVKVVASQDFDLSYLPLKRGFATFGGLWVVLIEDVTVNEGQEESAQSRHHAEDVRVLKE